ncbi:hypothetical protein TWF703_007099 [Orbilia oligospora]|uniref:Uncharacterized protein n=1 Tax=Orbilia oligospora TaxID=2813651 RepID=A0A7C8NX18_ORBOL|nr:hypothetical protein TWF703_007099 [Orbilia oligospora]
MHLSIPLTPLAIALLGVSELVSAHVVFVKAVGSGDESFAGYGLGYDANNKRDGGGFFPWQKDVTVFDHKVVHNKWNKKYIHTGCGVTTDSLVTQVQRVDQAGWMHWGKKTRFDNAIKQTLKTGIPKVVPGGKVKITAWQVNQDGGGPFKCMIDYNGNANQWTTEGLPVTTSCQGNADSIRPWGAPAPCEIEVTLPANLNCVGKYTAQRICILRCQNQAHNGPFGGCIPLQQLEPTPQKVVETKKVHVPVVKPAETVVLPPKVVTVTKDNVITIIQGGHTRVSVPTKNNIVTVTQVIERPPKTVVEVQEKTVVIEKQVYPTKVLTDIGRPIKPSPRPPTNKKPTEAELKAGLGGEDYDNSVIEELRNVYITDEEKQKLGKQASQKSSYYKRKLRFRRNADEE